MKTKTTIRKAYTDFLPARLQPVVGKQGVDRLFVKLFVLALILGFQFFPLNSFSQGVAINTDGSNADNSAILDIKSTTQGTLIPRMTLAQRALLIGSDGIAGNAPATGCLIYQIDNTPGYYYYNGTVWVPLFSGTNGWALAGNLLSGTEFLGSTNAQPIIFKTNNTEWMRVLSTGNIGIGTTSPNASLDVNGSGSTNASYSLAVRNSSDVYAMVVRDDGNVGIGTVTPIEKLHVFNNADAIKNTIYGYATQVSTSVDYHNVGILGFAKGANNSWGYAAGIMGIADKVNSYHAIGVYAGLGSSIPDLTTKNYDIALFADGNSLGYSGVFMNGNVGIGTTTPSDKLHVLDGSISAENSNTYQKSILSVDGGLELYRSPSGATPEANGYVDFKDNPANDFDFRINFTNPSVIANSGALVFKSTTDGTSTTEQTRMIIKNDNGFVGIGTINPQYTLDVVGATRCTDGFWNSSDVRYKKDIKPITSALSKVLEIQGVTYHWRKEEFKDLNFNNTLQYGVIAQELEKIFPELVNTDTKGYKSVDYAKLTPVLVEAIKEQQKAIDNLQSIIAKQQTANDKLKADIEKIKQKLEIEVKK